MSENESRRTGALEKYQAMTTEELEEILRQDAQAPQEQESDIEEILYVMEVLTERKRNTPRSGKTALEAYESFKQDYLCETKATAFLRRYRGLAAAAAVLVILILGSFTAKAFGCNLWETVVKWTQETFHIGQWNTSDTKKDLPFNSLQEALENGNTPAWLVPTWIPEEFVLHNIYIDQTPLQKSYAAKYINGEQALVITVQDYLDNKPFYIEQSDGLIEEYTVSGITYYLSANHNSVKAVWIADTCECYVSGNITLAELKQMIESISLEKG